MSKRTKTIIVILIVSWFFYGTFLVEDENDDKNIIVYDPYELSKVERFNAEPFYESVTANGNAKPTKEQKVFLKEDKMVEKVFVKNGQKVKKGDLIALLGTFRERKNAINRLKKLKNSTYYESRKIENESKDIELNFNKPDLSRSLDGSIKTHEEEASQLIIVAKFDGIIIDIKLKEGLIAETNKDTPVVEIADIDNLTVNLDVSDIHIGKISPELSTATAFNQKNEPYDAQISLIGGKINELTGTFSVNINIDNKEHKIASGERLKIKLSLHPVDGFLINDSAIVTNKDGYPSIKIIEDGIVKEQKISILKSEDKLGKTWIKANKPSIDVIIMGAPLFANEQEIDIKKFKNKLD